MRATRLLALALLLAIAAAAGVRWLETRQSSPLRVGILHSLSGTMALSERPLVRAALLAIEEVNREGGVLGRQIQPVIADGQSDPEEFSRLAGRLIRDEEVAALFGCWTSSSRKKVVPVVEGYRHLLFYPVQYEGLEQSPHVVYLGLVPNQQILPAVRWVLRGLGKRRVFLVGSDYIFPRAANEIIRGHVRKWRGAIVGEVYIPLGSHDVSGVVREILRAHPDVILNTLNGDVNTVFFRELRHAGISSREVPTVSFSIAEIELAASPAPEIFTGDYAAWNYFQSLPTEENRRLVSAFRKRYGPRQVLDDPMVSSYVAIRLWAATVRETGTADPAVIARKVVDRSLPTASGMLYIDDNRHTWQAIRIGRIRQDGQFDVVWDSRRPIRPIPYPPQKSRKQWEDFLRGLQRNEHHRR